MGALAIGRVGLDLDLDASELRFSSRRDTMLRIEGEVAPNSSAEATSIRDELIRMAETDDLLLPITLSSDPTIDGFYELTDVTLETGVASLSGYYPFRATLRRLGSEGKVAIESRLTLGLRANDHSITFGTSEPFWAASDVGNPTIELGAAVGLSTLDRDAGSFNLVVYRDVPDTLLSIVHGVEAVNYYSGAVTVEVGSVLRVISGRDSDNEPMNWRLGNGLIRVSANGSNGRLDVEHFDGTSWEAAKTYTLEEGGAEIGSWDYLAILRNDPAAATIRLVERQAGGAPVYLDLTLRRGSRFVEGQLARQRDTPTTSWNVERTATEAGTSLTGALRASANDGDGNRYVIGSSKTMTKDTTQGGIAPTSNATSFPFFIGSAVDGSGAAAGDTPSDLVNQYHGYLTEVLTAVKR